MTVPVNRLPAGLAGAARERGSLNILPFALNYAAADQLFLGQFGAAEQLYGKRRRSRLLSAGAPAAHFPSCSPPGEVSRNLPTTCVPP